MKVNIKKLHPDAVIPKYAKVGDAGMDLTCVSYEDCGIYNEYKTGLAVEIPEGFVGYVFPRSSVSKIGSSLCNSVGVVDSGYRGEVSLRFYGGPGHYEPGDRVGQLVIMPVPSVEFVEVDELSSTDRGTGGFGSTGA